ncbi:MAG TPA: sigma-70 family RNA polymerase sigma factor, partial [Polyangiaceae bacterium]
MKKSSARSRVDRLALELQKLRVSALSMATRFGDRIMAEDVLQEAWLRSVESSTAPDEIADLPAWLMGIVRNVARDRLRSEQRRRQVELQLEWLANQGRGLFWNRLPEVALDERRTEILIRSAIARLSQSSRQAVELFYFGDYSVEETAQALGVSPNVVKARLFKARKKLRGWLELLANDSQVKNELTSRKSPFELIHGGL